MEFYESSFYQMKFDLESHICYLYHLKDEIYLYYIVDEE